MRKHFSEFVLSSGGSPHLGALQEVQQARLHRLAGAVPASAHPRLLAVRGGSPGISLPGGGGGPLPAGPSAGSPAAALDNIVHMLHFILLHSCTRMYTVLRVLSRDVEERFKPRLARATPYRGLTPPRRSRSPAVCTPTCLGSFCTFQVVHNLRSLWCAYTASQTRRTRVQGAGARLAELSHVFTCTCLYTYIYI